MKYKSLMNIQSIEIQGFRAFNKAGTLTIPTGGGFYLLTGKNNAEPALGNNGAGKSTVWDALSWCLWGETARGISGKHVVCWPKGKAVTDMTSVTVCLYHHGEHRVITRTQAPNSLKWKTVQHGKISMEHGEWSMVDQDKLVEWLGLGHEAFLQIMLMGQFGEFFFDMQPAAKLTMFSTAMGLDKWTGFAKEAGVKASAAEASLISANMALSNAEAGAFEVDNQVRDAKEQGQAWETGRTTRLEAASERVVKAQEAKGAAEAQESEHGAALAVARAGAAKLSNQLETASGHVSRITSDLRQAAGDIRGLESEKQGLRARFLAVKNLVGGACPTCEAPVCAKHADAVGVDLKVKADFVTLQSNQAKEKEEALLKEQALWQGRLTGVKEKNAANVKEVDACLSAQRQAAAITGRYAADLRMALHDVDLISKETNPHTASLASAKSKALKYATDAENAKEARALAEGKALEGAFWAKEFKSVRLWLMDKALRELEIEVNNALIQLGLKEWRVEFAVERDNAAGGVTRGFTVNIASPYSNGAVPWKAWSGGETQRLRIAGAIGLSAFLRGRLGVNPNIEVWDEPTEHLSKQGVDDLLEFMAHRAQEEGRSIWLIDPRSLEAGAFDARYIVTKEVNGARIAMLTDAPE